MNLKISENTQQLHGTMGDINQFQLLKRIKDEEYSV